MTVIKRTGGIRAFLVERYLPIYPIYLTLGSRRREHHDRGDRLRRPHGARPGTPR
jgi:hypothetical protein